MKLDVIKNAKRNLIISNVCKLIMVIFPFLLRSVINSILGEEYLGLNSLFSSILSILNLSELGISTAIVQHMYRPIAEGDEEKVCSLLNLYRKIYRYIGFIILILGLLILRSIPYLIRGGSPGDVNVYFVYIILLFNTVISYFMYAYMGSLLIVYQRNDIKSTISTLVSVVLNISKIVVLILFKNYYLMIIVQPFFTILENLWTAYVVKIRYPEYQCKGNVDENSILSIKKFVAGTLVQKICTVSRNSLDSICISAFMGLAVTGIYNNYYLIMSSITMFMSSFYNSFLGGVGNNIVLKSKEDNFREMKNLDFVYMWISGFCTICLLNLYQPFMKLWMGENMLLKSPAVVLLSIYFYCLMIGDVRYIYFEANGLFWEGRYRAICETIFNIILNICLGYFFGINGIILATIITIFIFCHIWGVDILFKNYFGRDKKKVYYLYQAKYALITFIVAIIVGMICNTLVVNNPIANLAFRLGICVVVSNLCYYLIYHKTEEYKYFVSKLSRGI